mmetsp:Transcript_4289/g.10186  ORF Transcript_4289/g.10186 Transcript_4289/m.10186 type:complete len:217 (-) Transcript_4289:1516-2166(-)
MRPSPSVAPGACARAAEAKDSPRSCSASVCTDPLPLQGPSSTDAVALALETFQLRGDTVGAAVVGTPPSPNSRRPKKPTVSLAATQRCNRVAASSICSTRRTPTGDCHCPTLCPPLALPVAAVAAVMAERCASRVRWRGVSCASLGACCSERGVGGSDAHRPDGRPRGEMSKISVCCCAAKAILALRRLDGSIAGSAPNDAAGAWGSGRNSLCLPI